MSSSPLSYSRPSKSKDQIGSLRNSRGIAEEAQNKARAVQRGAAWFCIKCIVPKPSKFCSTCGGQNVPINTCSGCRWEGNSPTNANCSRCNKKLWKTIAEENGATAAEPAKPTPKSTFQVTKATPNTPTKPITPTPSPTPLSKNNQTSETAKSVETPKHMSVANKPVEAPKSPRSEPKKIVEPLDKPSVSINKAVEVPKSPRNEPIKTASPSISIANKSNEAPKSPRNEPIKTASPSISIANKSNEAPKSPRAQYDSTDSSQTQSLQNQIHHLQNKLAEVEKEKEEYKNSASVLARQLSQVCDKEEAYQAMAESQNQLVNYVKDLEKALDAAETDLATLQDDNNAMVEKLRSLNWEVSIDTNLGKLIFIPIKT